MDKNTEKALLGATSIIYTIDRYKNEKMATCFFIRKEIAGNMRHFLITNKHVLEDKIEVSLRLDLYNTISKTHTYNHKIALTLGNDVYFHPEYDIAILNIDMIKNYKNENSIFSYTTIGVGMIPSDFNIFSYIQPILMIGYPNGVYNKTFNHPIVRSGITSSPINETYNNSNEFVIDIPSIGGSSGSPIFAEIDGKLYLVGVERATYTRKIEIDLYKNRLYHKKIHKATIDTQLGIAVRSDEISKMLVSVFGS